MDAKGDIWGKSVENQGRRANGGGEYEYIQYKHV
jgi:hypothetical protein